MQRAKIENELQANYESSKNESTKTVTRDALLELSRQIEYKLHCNSRLLNMYKLNGFKVVRESHKRQPQMENFL